MGDWILPIFPEGTLATSVTTTVWLGVWVVVFFNLRFGWPLSGLVVPGYLVPLLMAKPMSAGVVLLEAVITYGIVWLISERLDRRWGWSSFFGRDRFFAMVLVSVLVRSAMDGWLLPWAGPQLNELFGLELDYRNHWHSYGLIVVALLANYFWKPGVARGCFTLGVTVAVTYVLVRYVLIEWTNFNLGSLQYTYEDIASSLLASPKAYIVLLTTAFIASRMNLRYGWDYNGILIPALLALQWHAPLKIVYSFLEAGVILVGAAAILKLPMWQRTTMEGGRKTLLFFNIAFGYRLLLGLLIPLIWPDIKVSDLFGFGYLLSTLLAIKAHDKWRAVRLVRESMQVSMVGAVGGNLLGFGLALLPGLWIAGLAGADTPDTASTVAETRPGKLVDILRQDKLLLYQTRLPDAVRVPLAGDRANFVTGLRALQQYRNGRRQHDLSAARKALASVNYDVQVIEDRYVYLRESEPPRGWGIYALDLDNPDGVVVEVPAPLDEWGTLEAGLCLLRKLDGGALAVAGAKRRTNPDGSSDVLSHGQSMFHVFHQFVHRSNTIQIRGHTAGTVRKLAGVDRFAASAATENLTSSLWIKGSVPERLDLPRLRDLLVGFEIQWQTPPVTNVIRDGSWTGFGELILNRRDRRRLFSQLAADNLAPNDAQVAVRSGHLKDWLFRSRESIAPRGSDLYRPAREEELLLLDEEVLRPLLALAQRVRRGQPIAGVDREELNAVAAAARTLGYRFTVFRDQTSKEDFLLLHEDPTDPQRRYWGTFAFRCGVGSSYLVEVPRPLHERNALTYGAALFHRLPAAALLIAGAHPHANRDGAADVTRSFNRANMFHLVHQVTLRETGARPMLVVQSRAIRSPVQADVVLATDDGSHPGELSSLSQSLVELLRGDGTTIQFADGKAETAGYDVISGLQSLSLRHFENKEFLCLWLSPSLRSSYRLQDENQLQQSQFDALGISTVQVELDRYLMQLAAEPQTVVVPPAWRDRVRRYIAAEDIVALRGLQVEVPPGSLTRLLDPASRQTYLLISEPSQNGLPLVVNLAPRRGDSEVRLRSLNRDQIRYYVESRATWLEVERP